MQKKILIINGPNINLIGSREKNIYGETSIEEIKTECELHGQNIIILKLNLDNQIVKVTL